MKKSTREKSLRKRWFIKVIFFCSLIPPVAAAQQWNAELEGYQERGEVVINNTRLPLNDTDGNASTPPALVIQNNAGGYDWDNAIQLGTEVLVTDKATGLSKRYSLTDFQNLFTYEKQSTVLRLSTYAHRFSGRLRLTITSTVPAENDGSGKVTKTTCQLNAYSGTGTLLGTIMTIAAQSKTSLVSRKQTFSIGDYYSQGGGIINGALTCIADPTEPGPMDIRTDPWMPSFVTSTTVGHSEAKLEFTIVNKGATGLEYKESPKNLADVTGVSSGASTKIYDSRNKIHADYSFQVERYESCMDSARYNYQRQACQDSYDTQINAIKNSRVTRTVEYELPWNVNSAYAANSSKTIGVGATKNLGYDGQLRSGGIDPIEGDGWTARHVFLVDNPDNPTLFFFTAGRSGDKLDTYDFSSGLNFVNSLFDDDIPHPSAVFYSIKLK